MAKKKYKGIDLFCGIGGFRLAMEDNNVMCVFSSDNDKFAHCCPVKIRGMLFNLLIIN